jgi:polysaccharide pyruvyl transferase WcaK-like protein
LGDALLTDALAGALEARGHEVGIADFGAVKRTGDQRRIPLRGMKDLAREVRAAQAVIVGGGTLFQDDAASQFRGLPRLCLVVSAIAWLHRTPLAFFGVGCDPVRRSVPRIVLRVATAGRGVWASDALSVARCKTQFGSSAQLAADASLLALSQFEHLRDVRAASGSNLVIALNARDGAQLTQAALESVRVGFDSVEFVSMVQGDQVSDFSALEGDVQRSFPPYRGDVTWQDAAVRVATASTVIASRMHAMYMAIMLEVPAVALVGLPKVDSFIDEFQIGGARNIRDFGSRARVAKRERVRDAAARVDRALEDALVYLSGGKRRRVRGNSADGPVAVSSR